MKVALRPPLKMGNSVLYSATPGFSSFIELKTGTL